MDKEELEKDKELLAQNIRKKKTLFYFIKLAPKDDAEENRRQCKRNAKKNYTPDDRTHKHTRRERENM